MKTKLLQAALLAAALVACGCTNKEIEGPDETGAPDNNAAPVADAGADQTVSAGAQVTLTGSGSDADGTVTNYNWSQTGGDSITLNTDGHNAGFTAPQVQEATALVFELRVTDDGGAGSEADSVTVTVLPVIPREEKFLGTAVESPDDLAGPLTTYFEQVTPGNAGKWGSVEDARDVMDWTSLDDLHTFAANNELLFKQHTLFWGQQQPDWLGGLSAEEQMAEIEEWLEALAANYTPGGAGAPDLDMIDVVNEPLHAPPSYMEALGGAGESGWDWLINAFKLAREHFPESTLILNDYNILNLEENTEDYLLVVKLLQDLGLIDGIGVQAHFLEQTSAETVQKNLDLLGATGLPIYVSEFDINFADDARHANKLAELFTVFWEHPAVAGVTHWGYRQGAVWRENAWLLNSDATERPGLAWLRCYAVDGNDDCVLPEYVPAGWAGDASGLVLEAELFDEGEGVAASGSIIHNVDVSDWIAFKSVEFQPGWEGLFVNYAKGGDTTGSLSVRLDSLDNPNLLRLDLPPTGDWGSFQTAQAEWAPLEGEHDVYIRFNDVASVGNIDWLRFGPNNLVQKNLASDGDMEGSGAAWDIWYSPSLGEVELTSDQAKAGTQSLRVFNRQEGSGNSPSYNLTGKVEPGETLQVSVWAMHSGPDAAPMTLSFKRACNGGDMEDYGPLAAQSEMPAGEWVEFAGELDLSGCESIDEVRIYFENTPVSVENIYIDELEVLGWRIGGDAESNGSLVEGRFEGDLGNWNAGAAQSSDLGTIEISSEQAHSGNSSLKASGFFSNGDDEWGRYASHPLTEELVPGNSYGVSAWVYLSEADVVSLTRELDGCGEDTQQWAAVAGQVEIPAGTWTHIGGQFSVPESCELSAARVYFEHTSGGVDVYIDDMTVAPNLLEGDFESGTGDWNAGAADQSDVGTIEASSEQAQSGEQSLKASGFFSSGEDAWGRYASHPLTELLKPGASYGVSAWVYLSEADVVSLTRELDGCGEGTEQWEAVAGQVEIPAQTWTPIGGQFSVPEGCELNAARVYFEHTSGGVDVYIDNVAVAEM